MTNLVSQKMGIHEWSYDNAITLDRRFKVPHVENAVALRNIETEVELGFDLKQALGEAQRCLNCDVQTVFSAPLCIECDACVDVCPIDCISFVPNAPEAELRQFAGARPRSILPRRSMSRSRSRPAGSWSRTRISACTAGSAPNAARPAPGT